MEPCGTPQLGQALQEKQPITQTVFCFFFHKQNSAALTGFRSLKLMSSSLFTSFAVRPKLNVKPSVVKPSVQLKAGQKRRGAEWSAVAAVKPLKSTSTVLEEPLQKEVCPEIILTPPHISPFSFIVTGNKANVGLLLDLTKVF